jgi:prevent-host-death family protein
MRIVPVAEVKAQFSAYLKHCEEGPVIITRNGRPKALLIAAPDDDTLERLVLAHTPRFQQLLRAARERAQEDGVEHDDFWRLMEEESEPLALEEA